MADQIHPIYRAWFLWVDPILTIAGMYGNLFAHDLAVEAFFANYPLTEELKPFLYQIGGMGTSYLVLLVFLQRYTQDPDLALWSERYQSGTRTRERPARRRSASSKGWGEDFCARSKGDHDKQA